MGELFGISGTTEMALSLRFAGAQAARGYREEGWGVAALRGPAAVVLKEPASRPDAATATMLRDGRALRGDGAIAYIRRWTHSASLKNCHPFVRELGGREWAFAHNGNVAGVLRDSRWRPRRFVPIGGTDSESAFCALLDCVAETLPEGGPRTDPPDPEALAALLQPPSIAIARHGMFNYVLLTERRLVVFSSGEYGLYVRETEGEAFQTLELIDEDWEIRVAATDGAGACVVVASNPMGGPGWRRLGRGEMLVAAAGRWAARRPPPPPQRAVRRAAPPS